MLNSMVKNPERRDLFPGAIEIMALQSLRLRPMHGYALMKYIKQVSDNLLQVEQGSLYPALHIENNLTDKLAAIPGVTSVGFASAMPMDRIEPGWDEVRIRGEGLWKPGPSPPILNFVSPGYFHTAGQDWLRDAISTGPIPTV
jgi:Transcriptional regulator PadR-like family